MRTIQVKVKVKPDARSISLEEVAAGLWLAQLKSPPVDGKANDELVALVAGHFGCPSPPFRSGAARRHG